MEFLPLYIIGLCFLYPLFKVVFKGIKIIIDKRRTKVRENVTIEFKKQTNDFEVIKNYQIKINKLKRSKSNNSMRIKDNGDFLSDCPKCKLGYLVVRKGKHGSFIGCSHYPNCNYTENLLKGSFSSSEISKKIIYDLNKVYE